MRVRKAEVRVREGGRVEKRKREGGKGNREREREPQREREEDGGGRVIGVGMYNSAVHRSLPQCYSSLPPHIHTHTLSHIHTFSWFGRYQCYRVSLRRCVCVRM